jgi:hypothetical protein
MRTIRRRRYTHVVQHDWRRRWRHGRRIDGVVVPTDPQAVQAAIFVVSPVGQAGQGKPDVAQDARRHVPHECLEIDHARNGERHQRAQHLPALLGDHVLLNPRLRPVSEGEFPGELAVVVPETARGDAVWCGRRHPGPVRRGPLLRPVLVGEAVIAHDERGQAVGEGIDARARLRVRALVGPYDVEARVDARDGEAVQGRVAKGERRQVVRVRKLSRSAEYLSERTATPYWSRLDTDLVYDFLEDVHRQVEQAQRPFNSLLFPLWRLVGRLYGWRWRLARTLHALSSGRRMKPRFFELAQSRHNMDVVMRGRLWAAPVFFGGRRRQRPGRVGNDRGGSHAAKGDAGWSGAVTLTVRDSQASDSAAAFASSRFCLRGLREWLLCCRSRPIERQALG